MLACSRFTLHRHWAYQEQKEHKMIALLALVLFGATPCDDSLANALKHKPLDSLSQRQYDYVMLVQKSCAEQISGRAAAKPDSGWLQVFLGQDDEYNTKGFEPFQTIYVDGVLHGTGKVVESLAVGKHRVSLFADEVLQSESGGDKERMLTATTTVEIKPRSTRTIVFTFTCEEHSCDDNEWAYRTSVR